MTDPLKQSIRTLIAELLDDSPSFSDRLRLWFLKLATMRKVSAQKASVISFFLGPMLYGRGPVPEAEDFFFPTDHRLDLSLPNGWYFLVSHLDITAERQPDGEVVPCEGTIALVTVMMRIWAVDPTTASGVTGAKGQQLLEQVQVLDGTTSATVLVPSKGIATRQRTPANIHNLLADGDVHFPGADGFSVRSGTLAYEGPRWAEGDERQGEAAAIETLFPLRATSTPGAGRDGAHMDFELDYTATPQDPDAVTPRATYFLEGDHGFAPLPDMGINYEYYSVAQIPTDGVFRHDGVEYEVTGSSWFDHQWGGRHPRGRLSIDFPEPRKFGGWVWMFFHLPNGDAITFDALHAPVGFWKKDFGERELTGFGRYITSGEEKSVPFVGTVQLGQYVKSRLTSARYPNHWHLVLHEAEFEDRDGVTEPVAMPGGRTIELDVEAIHDDQSAMFGNLNEFYEGGNRIVSGSISGPDEEPRPIEGIGFSEGVGFEKQLYTVGRLARFALFGR